MTTPLDDLYLEWLYSQVGDVNVRSRARTHWSLLRQLHQKEFVWFVPNDDNRLADGQDLRFEFLEANGVSNPDSRWMSSGCSMLELLVALSRQLSFGGDGEPSVWFWHLIETMGLEQYNDRYFDQRARGAIEDALNRVIYRTYAPNGIGGLFPLRNPTHDQREVELWYQLNAYLNEL